jgi:hypothetical protein
VGIRQAEHVARSIRKFGTNFADKRLSLGRYSSIAGSGHGLRFLFLCELLKSWKHRHYVQMLSFALCAGNSTIYIYIYIVINHRDIKSRLNSGSAYCHSVQNHLSSRVIQGLPKRITRFHTPVAQRRKQTRDFASKTEMSKYMVLPDVSCFRCAVIKSSFLCYRMTRDIFLLLSLPLLYSDHRQATRRCRNLAFFPDIHRAKICSKTKDTRQVSVCQNEMWADGLLGGAAVISGCDRGREGGGDEIPFQTPGVCLREPKIA